MPASPSDKNNAAVSTNDKKVLDAEDTQDQPATIKKAMTSEEHSPPATTLEHEDDVDEEELGDEEENEAGQATETEHADILRRKRDREGSLEPTFSSSQQSVSTSDAIPTKKNRLQDSVIGEEAPPSSTTATPSSPNHKAVEGEKVGQIRKRVQDLSWKQRKEGDRDGEEEEPEEEKVDLKAPQSSPPEDKTTQTKRTQPSFSSFSSKPSAFTASASKPDENNFLASKTSNAKPSSPVGAGRTQPTFSSFSKSSSPFNTASSVAGPSWLAGKSGSGTTTDSPGGGIRPSALGSVGSPSGSPRESPANTSSSSEKEKEKVTSTPVPCNPSPSSTTSSSTGNKQLGFGAFTSSKTFGGSKNVTPTSAAEKLANGNEIEESKGESFDDVLRKADEEKGSGLEGKKVSTQLDRGEADLRTGEEDEKTLTSARAKLFTMSEDKSWKERGTGMVRCNVGKAHGGGARLVMRSEGVLRLILNINLFKGMKIYLEQDKFLRIVALEDGKLVHFVIKFANPMAAGNFYQIVKHTIPAEDGDEQA